MSTHPSGSFDSFQIGDGMDRSERRQHQVLNRITGHHNFFTSNLQQSSFHGRNTSDWRTRNELLVVENNHSRKQQRGQPSCSYDGHLIWKIKNFQQRVDKLLSGELPALESEPCFTSRYGYKYCLRLHQYHREPQQRHCQYHHDKQDTELNLFFQLMRTEFDNILSWPFKMDVRCRLLNQCGDRTKDKCGQGFINWNENRMCFVKPEMTANLPCPYPLLLKLNALENEKFLMDDSIFIECKVKK